VDPSLSVGQVETMDAIVRRARGREAFVGALLLLAAVVSLFLGTVGIYGSVTQVVKRRTREIGIRVTLGAGRAEVVRMVAENSLRAALVGTGCGLVVALAATKALQSILFDVEPNDPGSLIVVTALLLTAAIAAALVAASRAARVDPSRALRME
jgi:putative ABC transport system permease protein